jgi:hypothetical protein
MGKVDTNVGELVGMIGRGDLRPSECSAATYGSDARLMAFVRAVRTYLRVREAA